MAFLTINGFEISILDGSADVSEEEIGSSTRAFSGHLIQSTRARARVFSGKTPILSAANAKATTGLLKADGHYWGFDDQYSSKGLGVASGTYTITSGLIQILGGNTVTFDTNIGSAWTIVAKQNIGSMFTIDSDGNQYVNGVTTTGNNYFLNVSSGDMVLSGKSNTNTNTVRQWDDVLIFPFAMTVSMHEFFSTPSALFSEVPALTVSGNALKSESVTMRLRHGSLSDELIQYMTGGSVATGFQVAFTLEEVL
jgi:hypothetical protein